VRVFLDDQTILDNWSTGSGPASSEYVEGGAGTRHRFRVEFAYTTTSGPAAALQLQWKPAVGGSWANVPLNAYTPRYGLATRQTTKDTGGTAPDTETVTSYSDPVAGIDPALSLPVSTILAGSLVTKTSYEPIGAGQFLRRTATTLPAGTTTTYAYYPPSPSSGFDRVNPCTGGTAINQGGLLETATSPAPAAGDAVLTETVRDNAGRTVAARTGFDSWTCTTYDTRGRVASVAIPANTSAPARTITYNYAVGGNPLLSSVSDSVGTITTGVDMIGRVESYTDVWGDVTTTTYDDTGLVDQKLGQNVTMDFK
jgi:hypothetical protein